MTERKHDDAARIAQAHGFKPGEWEKILEEEIEKNREKRRLAQRRAERHSHDSDLFEGGSAFVDVGQKTGHMVVTPEQIEKARKEMRHRLG